MTITDARAQPPRAVMADTLAEMVDTLVQLEASIAQLTAARTQLLETMRTWSDVAWDTRTTWADVARPAPLL